MKTNSGKISSETTSFERRNFLKISSLASLSLFLGGASLPMNAFTTHDNGKERYKIAVCDWMILRRQKISGFDLAQEINADGIELDMGSLGDRRTFESKLNDPEMQKKFREKSESTGVEISSIAMSGFYAQSFAERPTVNIMVQDTIDTMEAMDVKIAYLPLGVQGDMKKEPHLRPAIVERLKWAGEKVDAIGGVIAVETSFSASEELQFLREVDSPNIKSSFNFANAIRNGEDICKELQILGRDNIAQIHCSNTDGEWIQNDPQLDMPEIKETLDEMKWKGWLIIERSRDVDMVRDVVGNYGANVAYMKKIFQ